MVIDTVQTSLVSYPTPVYLTVATIMSVFALDSSPSFLPLVILLGILRLWLGTTINEDLAWAKLMLAVFFLAGSSTIANIRPSLDAMPELHTSTAIFSLFALTCFTCTIALGTLFVDTSFRSSVRHPWTQLVLFPTIWTTTNILISRLSPLGYIATWSPVQGVSAYSWLRPALGPSGVDWAVGAWAVILSDLLEMWIVGRKNEAVDELEDLISIVVSEDGVDEPEGPHRSRWLLFLCGILCAGALPSYFIKVLPTPINSPSTTPLAVACALPFSEGFQRTPSFDEYIHETQVLTPLAKVVIWPEGAVQFESAKIKEELIERVANSAAGSVVGVGFEDHMPNQTLGTNDIRNGFMLIDKDGLVFEYYKRHLVPFVESNSMVPYSATPDIFDYQLATKRNSRGKVVESLSVPITASICLDFASHAPFSGLPRRPSLILGPAHTWHPDIGLAIWEQAKARAEEIGSAVLWCDGGLQGVSGIAGHGTGAGEIVQVGPGSWVRMIGLETAFDDTRTAYGRWGAWLAMGLIWTVFGLEYAVELAVLRWKGEERIGVSMALPSFVNDALGRVVQWRRSRQIDDHGETGERATLLI